QREDVRAREEVDRTGAEAEEADGESNPEGDSSPGHRAEEECEDAGENHGGEQDKPFQAARRVIDLSEDYVSEPLPVEPGGSGLRERVGVGVRNGASREDRFAGAEVPAGVAVGEETLPAEGSGHEEPDHQRDEEEVGDRWDEQAAPDGLDRVRDLHRLA